MGLDARGLEYDAGYRTSSKHLSHNKMEGNNSLQYSRPASMPRETRVPSRGIFIPLYVPCPACHCQTVRGTRISEMEHQTCRNAKVVLAGTVEM